MIERLHLSSLLCPCYSSQRQLKGDFLSPDSTAPRLWCPRRCRRRGIRRIGSGLVFPVAAVRCAPVLLLLRDGVGIGTDGGAGTGVGIPDGVISGDSWRLVLIIAFVVVSLHKKQIAPAMICSRSSTRAGDNSIWWWIRRCQTTTLTRAAPYQ
jgi:hypothetical protein